MLIVSVEGCCKNSDANKPSEQHPMYVLFRGGGILVKCSAVLQFVCQNSLFSREPVYVMDLSGVQLNAAKSMLATIIVFYNDQIAYVSNHCHI